MVVAAIKETVSWRCKVEGSLTLSERLIPGILAKKSSKPLAILREHRQLQARPWRSAWLSHWLNTGHVPRCHHFWWGRLKKMRSMFQWWAPRCCAIISPLYRSRRCMPGSVLYRYPRILRAFALDLYARLKTCRDISNVSAYLSLGDVTERVCWRC